MTQNGAAVACGGAGAGDGTGNIEQPTKAILTAMNQILLPPMQLPEQKNNNNNNLKQASEQSRS